MVWYIRHHHHRMMDFRFTTSVEECCCQSGRTHPKVFYIRILAACTWSEKSSEFMLPWFKHQCLSRKLSLVETSVMAITANPSCVRNEQRCQRRPGRAATITACPCAQHRLDYLARFLTLIKLTYVISNLQPTATNL